MPARFRLFHSSYIRRTTALFSSVDMGLPPSTLSRIGHTKNRRTTLTVVAGFTCCSPQPGWPGRGRRQGNGAVGLDPHPLWRCSLTMAAVHRIHGSERTTLAPPSVAHTDVA